MASAKLMWYIYPKLFFWRLLLLEKVSFDLQVKFTNLVSFLINQYCRFYFEKILYNFLNHFSWCNNLSNPRDTMTFTAAKFPWKQFILPMWYFHAKMECFWKVFYYICENFVKIDFKTNFFLSFLVENSLRNKEMLRQELTQK